MLTPQEMQDFIQFYEAFTTFQQMKQLQASAPTVDGGPVQHFRQSVEAPIKSTNPVQNDSIIKELEAQITTLTAQLAEARTNAEREQQEKENIQGEAQRKLEKAEEKAQKELLKLQKKVEKLEKVSGRKIEQLTEDLQKNRKVIPHEGRGAHDAYAEMIDAGKLTRDQADYMDSEDVLDAIEKDENGEGRLEDLLANAEKTTEEQMNNQPTNELGF